MSLVTGQTSVRYSEWIESLKTFGISTEEGKRIIRRMGLTILEEHEKMFENYWSQMLYNGTTYLEY